MLGAVASLMPSRGKTYGERWQVVRSLGEGGQAHTFLVRDLGSGNRGLFVLKRLKNPRRLGRFTQEIEALRALDSERLARVVDFRPDASPAYFVTEYRGRDLTRWVMGNPLNIAERLRIFRDIVEGVAAAHSRGITHRDIKPNNVVVDDDGRACVIDFGICQIIDDDLVLTTTDEAFGNAAFAAPECFLGSDQPITTRSDVYSLGKLLLWLTTNGMHMNREELSEALIVAIDHADPWVKAHVAQLVTVSTVRRQISDASLLLDALDGLIRAIGPHVHPSDPRVHVVWDSTGPDGLGNPYSGNSATATPHERHEIAQAFHYVDDHGSVCLSECALLVRDFRQDMAATVRLLAHCDSGPDEERVLWTGAPLSNAPLLYRVTEIVVYPGPSVRLEPGCTYWVCLSVDTLGTNVPWVTGWSGWEPATRILRSVGLGNLRAERGYGQPWALSEPTGAGGSLRITAQLSD